jgi:hypothetical protein
MGLGMTFLHLGYSTYRKKKKTDKVVMTVVDTRATSLGATVTVSILDRISAAMVSGDGLAWKLPTCAAVSGAYMTSGVVF